MEPCRMPRKRAKDGAEPVGILPVELRMRRQFPRDRNGAIRRGIADLQPEPFVHDKPVIAPLIIECSRLRLSLADHQQIRQGSLLLGHIVGVGELGGRMLTAVNLTEIFKHLVP